VTGDSSIGTDSLTSIESVTGTNFIDSYTANGLNFNEFDGAGGNDTITGNGNTRISYQSASAGVTVTFSSVTAGSGTAAGTASGDAAGVGTDTFTGVKSVFGSEFDDIVGSDLENNTFNGGGGNDTLQGGAGNDTLDGGTGLDRAIYTDAGASITINMALGTVTSTAGGDAAGIGTDTLRSIEFVRGSNSADTYIATNFGTTGFLNPSTNNVGSNGTFNEFEGGGGNDTITGNGDTRISYRNAANAVTVTFSSPGGGTGQSTVGDDAAVGVDTFTLVNSVRGSNYADTFTGSSASDTFEGRGGNDTINGGGGIDRAVYNIDPATFSGIAVNLADGTVHSINVSDTSVGSDILHSIEAVRGTNFADSYDATGFNGSSANAGSQGAINEFEGMGGNDIIIGNGLTQLAFYNATGAVTVDLAYGVATGDDSVGTDTFTDVSNVVGSNFGDTLLGSNNPSGIVENFGGGAGNDVINGRGGLDRARYENTTGSLGITVNIAAGTVISSNTSVGNDTLRSVEFVRGTNFSDSFNATGFGSFSMNAGSNGNLNEFEGMGGSDTIIGNGDTRISYWNASAGVTVTFSSWVGGQGATGTAASTASGDTAHIGSDTFSGVNSVRGSNFGDILTGSNNDSGTVEIFEGRGGDDTINGAGGFDRAVYNLDTSTTAGITVNLNTATEIGSVTGDSTVGTDSITSIESVVGTKFIDSYTTSGSGFNEFEGAGGNDTITGNGNTLISYSGAADGVTVIFSSPGAGTGQGTVPGDLAAVGVDTFTGVNYVRGSNFADRFTGSSASETFEGRSGNDTFVFAAGSGHDTVTDFLSGQDKLDVDFNLNVAALQALLTGNDTDTINFASGDSVILSGIIVSSLTTADFILHH